MPETDGTDPFPLALLRMGLNRYFVDTLASGALASLLFLIGVSGLAVGQLAAFFSPAPIIWVTARHGKGTGATALLLSSSFVLPFLSLPAVISFTVGSSLLGLLFGLLLARGTGFVKAGVLTAAAVIVLSFSSSAIYLLASGLEPAASLGYQVDEVVGEARTALEELSLRSDSGTPADAETFVDLFRAFLPAVLLITLFLQSTSNGFLALILLSRREPGRWRFPDLRSFSLPDVAVWFLIPVLALQWVPSRPLRTAVLNAAILLLFFYLLQGLSIVIHFLRRWNASRPLRMILVILVLLQPYLLALPLLAGLLDFKFSWRERWPLNPPPPPDGQAS